MEAAVKELEVTSKDIATGIKGSRWERPIAKAANRAFGMDEGCEFGDDMIDGFVLERYEQRYEVVGGWQFARAFDGHEDEEEVGLEPRKFALIRLDDKECDENDEDD